MEIVDVREEEVNRGTLTTPTCPHSESIVNIEDC